MSDLICLLNDKFILKKDAVISCDDRGFLLSDGLFETMRCHNGNIVSLEEHIERLNTGLSVLKIKHDFPFCFFVEKIKKLLDFNKFNDKDVVVRLTVTRGVSNRGVLPSENCEPTILLTMTEITAKTPDFFNVIISEIIKNEHSKLTKFKSLNYLDSILAKIEASDNGCDDGIFLNTKGNVSDSSIANVFIVINDGTVLTPKLDDGALNGITRKNVIRICKESKINVKEASITKCELLSSKEVFLTNSVFGVVPVMSIDGVSTARGHVTTKFLKEKYDDVVNYKYFYGNC